MHVREAAVRDNDELQELQRECPQGTTIIVSTVNTPDFFARAKAYETYRVFVASEEHKIIGSAACALRDGLVNGNVRKIGYFFQAFVHPRCRRKGIAGLLLRKCLDSLAEQGAVLAYALIMEGNRPSMRFVESHGLRPHRELIMPALAVRKRMPVQAPGKIRAATEKDFVEIAELLNHTWGSCQLYEPVTPERLARFVDRTPAYSMANMLVLERRGKVSACLGSWDWSKVMRLTVRALSTRMRLLGFLLTGVRLVADFPKPGDILKQVMLTPIGFRDPGDLRALIRTVNNHALQPGIRQIFLVCERGHDLLDSMKGFIKVTTRLHVYIKIFHKDVYLNDGPIFIDGIDM